MGLAVQIRLRLKILLYFLLDFDFIYDIYNQSYIGREMMHMLDLGVNYWILILILIVWINKLHIRLLGPNEPGYQENLYRKRQIHTLQVSKACFGGMLMPLPHLCLLSHPSHLCLYLYFYSVHRLIDESTSIQSSICN